MLVGLYSAATGLEAAERMHDMTAENLAHANVPGYRAYVMTQETFEQSMQNALDSVSPEGHGTAVAELQTDFTPGSTAHTGRNLDLAIAGEGFFEVAGPNGTYYTRNGVFFLDAEGQLVNSEGMALQGTNGALTIPSGLSSELIHVAQDGAVSVDGQEIGQLRISQFADNHQLVREGTTLFSAPQGVNPTPSQASILQGVRELANVSVVNEMVRMIWGTRHYEAAQKAITTLDNAIGEVTDPQT